jgi:hypothetical protein
MEGWRQRRLGSDAKKKHKEGKKTDLTLTGLLMEGVGRQNLAVPARVCLAGKFVAPKSGEA